MKPPDWTTTFAKYGAAFLLGAASLAGMAWSLNRQPAAKVTLAPRGAAAPIQPPAPSAGRSHERPASAPSPAPSPAEDPTAAEVPVAAPSALASFAPPPGEVAPNPAHKVNLNTATKAELELLPGIGPAMAQRILDFRTAHGKFGSIDDLDKVKGIGPRTLAKLRPLVTLE
jgi:competence ComEA-like helix-hairpin-helix protein